MAREIYQKGMKKKTTTMTRMIIRTRMVIIWHLSAGVGKKESVGRELFHFPFAYSLYLDILQIAFFAKHCDKSLSKRKSWLVIKGGGTQVGTQVAMECRKNCQEPFVEEVSISSVNSSESQ